MSTGTPDNADLHGAIYQYFQWREQNTGKKQGKAILKDLATEFPQVKTSSASVLPILVPDLKVRYENYPLLMQQNAILQGRVAFLEQTMAMNNNPFVAAGIGPAVAMGGPPFIGTVLPPHMAAAAAAARTATAATHSPATSTRKRKAPPASAMDDDGVDDDDAKQPARTSVAGNKETATMPSAASPTAQRKPDNATPAVDAAESKPASLPAEGDGETIAATVEANPSEAKKAAARKPTPRRKKRRKKDPDPEYVPTAVVVSWELGYKQLVHYEKKHGNCRVPVAYKAVPGLGPWVTRQRALYKENRLTEEQVAKLEAINFEWALKELKKSWEEHYEGLKRFKSENGHTRVPRHSKNFRSLGEWVYKQRTQYHNKEACLMESNRFTKLLEIGFDFEFKKSWDEYFDMMVNFRTQHGHVNIPRPPRGKLAAEKSDETSEEDEENEEELPTEQLSLEEVRFRRWALYQKLAYWRYKKGDQNAMTSSRFKKLDSLGLGLVPEKIEPAVPAYRHHDDDKWNERLELLKQYKEQYGHCNVAPDPGPEWPKLGQWVRTQRRTYRLLQHGKKSALTQERLDALDSLGFEWIRRPGRLAENLVKKGDRDATNSVGVSRVPKKVGRVENANRRDDDTWNERLELLKQYKDKYGHCNVPHEPGRKWPKLGEWVKTQRRTYRLRQQGKQSPMTQARLDALESLGFQWILKPGALAKKDGTVHI